MNDYNNSYLKKYKDEIEAGNIIVGQELYQELCNLEDDLENDDYYYDTTDAITKIDFIENCVRLTKSPYYNKPMKLILFQKAFIECIYSYKMSATGFRRFKKILLLVGRKNGKSEICAAIGLTEFFLGNAGSDICCASNDDAQSSIIYNAIDTMRLLIDPREQDTHRNQQCITNMATNTKMFKMSDRTNNKEGRNIDDAFVDEIHEMKENVIGKSIEQSQSLKNEPLFFMITTEGFVKDGYLDDELIKARKIINKEDDGPAAIRTLPWLYTQDSEAEIFRNPASWVKSNPTLGVVKKVEYLEEQIDLARNSKADRIFVLSKDFNIKQNGVAQWLNDEDFNYEATYDIENFRGAICIGAVDLAETTDLCCAKILLMKSGDDTKYIYSKYFIPELKIKEDDDRNAGARYQEWADKGLIHICDGADVDLTVVADWFYSLYNDYDIKLWKCGYDQRFAREFLNRMSDYGWSRDDDSMHMILQNAQTLNNAIRLMESDLIHRKINYNNNDVDRWCFGNSCLKVDDKRQCLIVKDKNSEKIDGAVCLAILYEEYRRYRGEYRQIIEN